MTEPNAATPVATQMEPRGRRPDGQQSGGPAVIAMTSRSNLRGPRCITIQRSSAGFGFTLRHFIIYPPDPSDCPEEWQRGLSAGLDPMVPMDTIFVKHVKENGPAAKAGLSTGDQVVSVNGESVVCKSYVQVVQMIQKSGPTLQLVVMPKEHDVLQQCFADTAHNPYTNARPTSTAVPAVLGGGYQAPPIGAASSAAPAAPAPLPTSAALVAAVTAAAAAAAASSASREESAAAAGRLVLQDPSKTNIMSHLPRPKPYQPFQTDPKKAAATQAAAAAAAPALPATHASQTVVVVPRPSSSAVPLARVVSPLAPANAPDAAAAPQPRPVIDEAAAKARLAAAVALVSKSVRKSADFNASPVLASAGSRGSLAEYTPPPSAASKRSSYAGTPTSRAEFVVVSPHVAMQQQLQQQQSFHRDSISSSKGSLYSISDEQAQVMTRIKKSFEQKEEFLKRPALPYWVNVQEAPPVPKEFYAQPQKFSKPVWPPSSNASFDSDSGTHKVTVKTEVHHQVAAPEQWSVVFATNKATPPPPPPPPSSPGTGLVTNTVPKPFYGSPTSATTTASPTGTKVYVSTLTRIQENVPAGPFEPAKRTLTLQAPLASPEEFFTPSPTKSTQHPLASASVGPPPPPSVVKKPFENGAEKGLLARIAQRGKVQQQQHQPEANLSQGKQVARAPPPPPDEARKIEFHYASQGGTGNRTVIIGSSKLHCEPPGESSSSSSFTKESSDVAWAEERKCLVLRQHSYRTAVHEFADDKKVLISARTVKAKKSRDEHHEPPLQTNIDLVDNDEPSLSSSTQSLSRRPSPIASDFEMVILEHFDKLWASIGSGSSVSSITSSLANETSKLENNNESSKPGTNPITANVNRRQKIHHDDDVDRGMRRASYLKATAGNPVDGSPGANPPEAESQPTPAAPQAPEQSSKGSSSPWAVVRQNVVTTDRAQPGMISRLRQYFEDKSRVPSTNGLPSIRATPAPPPPLPPPPLAPSRRTTNQPHSIQKLRSLFGDKVGSVKTHSPGEFAAVVVAAATAAAGHSGDVNEPQRREGWLYVKQTISDGKRSTDRSWRQLWTRLRHGTVQFSRDRTGNANGTGANQSGSYADDMFIDLRGCTVEVAVYYTKRKHVLRLWTANGLLEYLLQCEDNNDMVLWLDSFQQERAVANDKEEPSFPGYSSSEMMLVHQAHEADHCRRQNRFMPNRNRSPTGHSPVSKTRKPSLPGSASSLGSAGNAELSPSTPATAKTTNWRHKVVKQIKKIQGSLPNSSGHAPNVPDGATIGVPLEYCPRSSVSENIPLLVELCVGIVEARGLESVGVYRVPGNSLAVNALTDSLNRGFDCINQSDPRWNDVNVISSLMKSFFRKLPDPLVTSELYGPLIEANKMEPEQARLNAIKRLVDELPEPHYYTLRFLINHLSRVAAKSYINKMEARNLAIVFGPTLIRPGDDSTVTMVNDMAHQCRIVETLIDKIDFFFPGDELDSIPPNSPTQTSSSNLSVEKDAYAKEIVLNIITAARKKRQSSLDSPDLSDRGDGKATPPVTGSAHSLVELGSTGCQPALPIEASEFRCGDVPPVPPERKRSASLGGETVLPPPLPPPSITGSHDLAGINEIEASDLRPRTSSGSFVNKIPPIDAAGIRSYSGLSAVTQERIRLFEQETKALLQRDLARRREETTSSNRRLDKSGSTVKLEMETDDFIDADNPTEKQPDKKEPDAKDLPEESKSDSTLAEEEPQPATEDDEKEKSSAPTSPTAKSATSSPPLAAATKQAVKVGVTATRSQVKVSKPEKPASPTPTKASLARAAVNKRPTQQVVSRAKTVDLGKANAPATVARKSSSVDHQPARVVRQSSLGTMQSQPSPTRGAPGRFSLRSKGSESPVKRLAAASSTVKSEDSKKAPSEGEQKRLLESNLDEQLNGPDSKTEPKEADLKKRIDLKDKGVKRSDSLTKDEKTENNVKARERDLKNPGQRLRRFVQRESGLKRRHTVGGTRDFDKARWLTNSTGNNTPAPRWSAWDRLQPLISDEDLNVDRSLKTWMRSERMRTSSPELCRRLESNATPLNLPATLLEVAPTTAPSDNAA